MLGTQAPKKTPTNMPILGTEEQVLAEFHAKKAAAIKLVRMELAQKHQVRKHIKSMQGLLKQLLEIGGDLISVPQPL